MKVKAFNLFLSMVLATLGWGYIFFFFNWKFGIALFLIVWANNITNNNKY